MQEFVTSVAAVDLSRTISGLQQRSCLQREHHSLQLQRSTDCGELLWRCTLNPGSEPGKTEHKHSYCVCSCQSALLELCCSICIKHEQKTVCYVMFSIWWHSGSYNKECKDIGKNLKVYISALHRCCSKNNLTLKICLRARREYWENLLPASGRPKCPSMATPADDYEKQLASKILTQLLVSAIQFVVVMFIFQDRISTFFHVKNDKQSTV